MRKNYTLSSFVKFIVPAFLLIIAFIIHSCKKDTKTGKPLDSATVQAKAWYESTYPATGAGSSTHVTQSTDNDLSQIAKPYWQQATRYSRYGKQVVELPIDPESKFASRLRLQNIGLNKAYSRSYFLLFHDTVGYEAYIMTIIADSAYVGSDLSKLDHNSYRKHDPDFSGVVLYFTPRGAYVNGYRFEGGQIVGSSAVQQTDQKKIQSTGLTPNTIVKQCTDWYLDYYVDGVLVRSVYIGTTCVNVDTNSNQNNMPGAGSPPPAGCGPPPASPPPAPASVPGNLIVQYLPPPPDGGMPPPATCGGGSGGSSTPPSSTPEPVTITNIIQNPCIKSQVQATISANIEFTLNATMQSVFGTNTDFNIQFADDIPAHLADPDESAQTDVNSTTLAQNTTRRIILGMDLKITINRTLLANASKEYIAATVIHEAFHAYLNANQTILNQHQDMAQNYFNTMKAELIKMFPNLDPAKAEALTWGGLEKDNLSTFNDLGTVMKNTIELTNDYYKSGQQGTPCTAAQ